VIWIVLNNRSYRVLKENLRRDGVGEQAARRLLGADLIDPELDFVSLAAGMGVRGRRVADPDDIPAALTEAVDAQEPYLLELVIDGEISTS
jgi:thiamine pyrophosphate-dependent acetolactate synthase large subunit-like protein